MQTDGGMEGQEERIVSISAEVLLELEQMGAISQAQVQSIQNAASETKARDAGLKVISVSSLNEMVSSGELTVAQRELLLDRSHTVRPFSVFGVPLNLTTVLIIVGIGLVVLSLGGLIGVIFTVAETRLGHVLLVSLLMVAFIGAGILVRSKLSPLAGELLVMGGVILTPWLVGAATAGKGQPVGIVTASMIVLGAIGWYIRRPTSEVFRSLSRIRLRLHVGPGLIVLVLASFIIPFVGVPVLALVLLLLPVIAMRDSPPGRIGDNLILLSVGITPAFLFTAGYALGVPGESWNASAVLFPSLAVFLLAYWVSRYFLYGLFISSSLVAAPIVVLFSFNDEPGLPLASGVIALSAAAVVGMGLAADLRNRSQGDSLNLWLWFHVIGLASFSGALFAYLLSFENERVFVAYAVTTVLVVFCALWLKRPTWMGIGLGSLGAYVIRLIVDTLGPDASYVLTVLGIVLVVVALYIRRRSQGKREASRAPESGA